MKGSFLAFIYQTINCCFFLSNLGTRRTLVRKNRFSETSDYKLSILTNCHILRSSFSKSLIDDYQFNKKTYFCHIQSINNPRYGSDSQESRNYLTGGRHGLAQRTGQEIRLEYRQEEVRYREGTGGYQGRKGL
ncbi:hypothetical protein HMPREF0103_3227 [Bacteroides sp. 2_1_33B]|nr:hypothetical protein HMPREF0103_3227 [Bacteroides sp. 2_1_33B]